MKVNIRDAKNRLPELLRAATAGEEVVIANRGRPVARLLGGQAEPVRTAPELPGADGRFATYLAEIDRIPDLPDADEPLDWDDQGLPR